jgi:hypothetical protein
MQASNFFKHVFASALLLLIGSTAHATTLTVHCGQKYGLNTIGAALRVLQNAESAGPHTISVSGACNENVTISGFNRLRLLAAPGATISDASGGTSDVLQMLDSSTVHVEGFILNGSVSCFEGSHCAFVADTFQNSLGDCVTVARSYTDLLPGSAVHGNVIQNCGGVGLTLTHGSVVRTIELTVEHITPGPGTFPGAAVFVDDASSLTAYTSSFVSNGNDGIYVRRHSTLALYPGSTVQGNGGNGISLESASEVGTNSISINDNGGVGISIGDLSFAQLGGPSSNITGNRGGTDVLCLPQFSATRGVHTNTGGGSTNCVEP